MAGEGTAVSVMWRGKILSVGSRAKIWKIERGNVEVNIWSREGYRIDMMISTEDFYNSS